MAEEISESRFYMWRAVVAMIHADEVVKPHEINFIFESTKNVPFNAEQRQIVSEDIETPRDIQEMFGKITNPRDKEEFFHLARAVAWSDGDLDVREESILKHFKMQELKKNSDDMKIMSGSMKSFNDIYSCREQNTPELSLRAVVDRLVGRG